MPHVSPCHAHAAHARHTLPTGDCFCLRLDWQSETLRTAAPGLERIRPVTTAVIITRVHCVT